MIPLTNPKSYYEEDFHRHVFMDEEGSSVAVIELDDIEDDRGGLWCEVTVYCKFAGNDPVVAFQRVNLITATGSGVKTIVTKLGDIGSMDWAGGMDVAVYRTVKTYRSDSTQSEWLTRVVQTSDDNPYLLKPFISRTGTTVMYGARGSGKSTFALKLAYAVASGEGIFGEVPIEVGPVLYLDFEDVARPHSFRLSALADGELDNLIFHVKITKSLKDARRLIRKIVRDEGIKLVVLDSVALARAADVSGSEATIKMFKTIEQFGVPILAIDHMTKEDNKRVATGKMDSRESSPIGSQFTESSARLTWFYNKMPQSTSFRKHVNLYNPKNNHGPEHDPIGIVVEITQGKHGQMTDLEFKMKSAPHDAIVANETKIHKHQELLLWHYTQQREGGGVIPMTLKEMGKSGINSSTIRVIVTTRNADWWEQVKGGKQYTLTPDGLEAAIFVNGMFGVAKDVAKDDG